MRWAGVQHQWPDEARVGSAGGQSIAQRQVRIVRIAKGAVAHTRAFKAPVAAGFVAGDEHASALLILDSIAHSASARIGQPGSPGIGQVASLEQGSGGAAELGGGGATGAGVRESRGAGSGDYVLRITHYPAPIRGQGQADP